MEIFGFNIPSSVVNVGNKILNIAFIVMLVITILFVISLFVMDEERTKDDYKATLFLFVNLIVIRVLYKL